MDDEGDTSPFRYHLELTPQQLKVTHTALRSLLDDFGHDEAEVHALIQEVLAKLPDEHAIRAIQLDQRAQGRRGDPRRGSRARAGSEPRPARSTRRPGRSGLGAAAHGRLTAGSGPPRSRRSRPASLASP